MKGAKTLVLLIAAAASAAFAGPRKVALLAQDHCTGGANPPLSQLADTLCSELTCGGIPIVIPDNSIARGLNGMDHAGILPEASAKAIGEMLAADGFLVASVGRYAAQSVPYNGAYAYRLAASVTLTLYDTSTGASVCSARFRDRSKTYTGEDMRLNAGLLAQDFFEETAAALAKSFLANYAKTAWEPAPCGTVRVFVGSNVLGADIRVDGASVGTCPGEFRVTKGLHKFQVAYEPYFIGFERTVNITGDGQVFDVKLQRNAAGEAERERALEYRKRLMEVDALLAALEMTNSLDRLEIERRKIELTAKRGQIEAEQAERCELFAKQLDLLDAQIRRYGESGKADDYVRRTLAEGVATYWKNSYGRIAITEGSVDNIEFATPLADGADIATPPAPGEIGEGIRKLLMTRPASR